MDAIAPISEFEPLELQKIGLSFESSPPQDILRWGIEQFPGRITLACSFGAEDVALIDLISRLDPAVPVFYLDTDYLFPETIDVRDRIVKRYGIRPVAVRTSISLEQQAAQHGPDLFARQPDLCCQIRKVEPLKGQLRGYQAWVTGVRRDQAPSRANTGLIEWDRLFGLVKLNPLARWTRDDLWTYIRANDVPYNTLHDRDYPSIGCWPCTRPVRPGEDPRAGRWANFAKQECGLHAETEPAPAG